MADKNVQTGQCQIGALDAKLSSHQVDRRRSLDYICLGRRRAGAVVVGDHVRSGGCGEGVAILEADGNGVARVGPTNVEISRCYWC